MTKPQRDALICELYKEGLTQAKLGSRFHLSNARIMQILQAGGVTKDERPKAGATRRPNFVGAHVTSPVKAALLEEARRDRKSISQFISDLVTQELRGRGVNLKAQPSSEQDVPLPLESS